MSSRSSSTVASCREACPPRWSRSKAVNRESCAPGGTPLPEPRSDRNSVRGHFRRRTVLWLRACALLGGLAVAGPGLARPAAADSELGGPILPVEEVRAGMRGHGETVFAGGQRERFEVEILGVLREMTPGNDAILARLTGHGLEKTGVIAGMSGSPVWIDGKLVGAVAFAWPFATEAIGGITPIEQMRAIPAAGPWPPGARTTSVTFEQLASGRLPADLLERAAERLVAATGAGARGAVTWSVTGIPGSGLERLRAAMPALT